MNTENYRIEKLVKSYRVLFAVCGVLTVASVVFRTVLMTDKYYDSDIMLYKTGPLPYIFYGFVVLSSVIFLISSLFIQSKGITVSLPKNKSVNFSEMSSSEKGLKIAGLIISALCGFFYISTIILQVLYKVNHLYLGMYNGALQYVTVALALPCAIYFFFIAFWREPSEALLAVLGICVTVWTISHLISAHLYMYIPLQSPERIFEILSYISILLYFLQEIRFHLNRQKPAFFVVFGFFCVFFTLTNAVPSLIIEFSSSLETLYNALEVSVALYVVLRLVLLCKNEYFTENVIEDNNDNRDDSLA